MRCDSGSSDTQRPGVVHVVGASEAGKTTLIERLVPRLRAQGIRVGTVKHAPHGFDTDRPGTDSWRHAQAGSEAVAVISPERAAWVIRTPEGLSVDSAIEPMAGRVDLVLVEGFKRDGVHPAIRLEPGSGGRLEIGAGACRVGVHPGALLPGELEQLTAFCVSVLMTVRVLCFAQLRDQIGDSEAAVPLPHGATGRELLRVLQDRHPRVGPLLEVSRLAVNCEYVSADSELHDGDEVVVIPPVSGG